MDRKKKKSKAKSENFSDFLKAFSIINILLYLSFLIILYISSYPNYSFSWISSAPFILAIIFSIFLYKKENTRLLIGLLIIYFVNFFYLLIFLLVGASIPIKILSEIIISFEVAGFLINLLLIVFSIICIANRKSKNIPKNSLKIILYFVLIIIFLSFVPRLVLKFFSG